MYRTCLLFASYMCQIVMGCFKIPQLKERNVREVKSKDLQEFIASIITYLKESQGRELLMEEKILFTDYELSAAHANKDVNSVEEEDHEVPLLYKIIQKSNCGDTVGPKDSIFPSFLSADEDSHVQKFEQKTRSSQSPHLFHAPSSQNFQSNLF